MDRPRATLKNMTAVRSLECIAAEDTVCMYCKQTIRNGASAIRCRLDDWQIEALGLDKRLWHPECWGKPRMSEAVSIQ